MKLRIHNQTLRIRLTEAELRRCLVDGRVVESLGATGPAAAFRYSLEIGAEGASPNLVLNAHGIRVVLARADAERIAGDAEGGVTCAVMAGPAAGATLHVERDGPETCPARATGRPCPLRSSSGS